MIELIAAISLSIDTYRIPPNYPQVAREGGIEAVCSVVFDVSALGETENICVACVAVPEAGDEITAAFEAATSQSVRRWAYQPSENGASNVRTQLDYRLDGDSTEPVAQLPLACPERTTQTPENID